MDSFVTLCTLIHLTRISRESSAGQGKVRLDASTCRKERLLNCNKRGETLRKRKKMQHERRRRNKILLFSSFSSAGWRREINGRWHVQLFFFSLMWRLTITLTSRATFLLVMHGSRIGVFFFQRSSYVTKHNASKKHYVTQWLTKLNMTVWRNSVLFSTLSANFSLWLNVP